LAQEGAMIQDAHIRVNEERRDTCDAKLKLWTEMTAEKSKLMMEKYEILAKEEI
jgi:hypothetical protein